MSQSFNFEIPFQTMKRPNLLAVVREQGVNGQTEMAAAFEKAGLWLLMYI